MDDPYVIINVNLRVRVRKSEFKDWGVVYGMTSQEVRKDIAEDILHHAAAIPGLEERNAVVELR